MTSVNCALNVTWTTMVEVFWWQVYCILYICVLYYKLLVGITTLFFSFWHIWRIRFSPTCPKCSLQERSARFLVIAQWETPHSGSSSTLILPGSSVAEYADLSTPLDETRVWDSWRVFGVSMSVSLISVGGVTALAALAWLQMKHSLLYLTFGAKMKEKDFLFRGTVSQLRICMTNREIKLKYLSEELVIVELMFI